MPHLAFRRLCVPVLLLGLSSACCLLVAELALRQLRPFDARVSVLYRIPHPVFGWSLAPNASYANPLPEGAVQVRYNAGGWRDVEHRRDKTPGTLRLLILGDSFMEGYSVDLQETFARRLEQAGRQGGLALEVVNMGVGGYSTLQAYLTYRDSGRAYCPDLVLLGFYPANDVLDNSPTLGLMLAPTSHRNKTRPFLDEKAAPTWKTTPVAYRGAMRRYPLEKAKYESFPHRWIRQSALVNSARRAQRFTTELVHTWRGSAHRRRQQRFTAQYGLYFCQPPPPYIQAWKNTRRILQRLHQAVAADGGRLIVFSVPALHEVDTQTRRYIERQTDAPELLCLTDELPPYQILPSLLGQLGIAYIDLLPAFRGHGPGDQALFHRSDRHWNAAGHRLAAAQVLAQLLAGGWLPDQAN